MAGAAPAGGQAQGAQGGQPATGGKGGGAGGQPSVYQQAAGGQSAAMAGTAMGMGYNPQQVQAGQLANTDLSAYYNPFENQVVQQSLQDIGQYAQQQGNQLAAQAQRAGAFGGSRSAILESQANEAALQQAARTASGLRLGGFQNAQQMAMQDIGNRLNADLANQGADLTGANLRLGAANQMGGLANQAFNMGNTINNQLMTQGTMQQMLQQQIFDRARAQYEGYQNFPAQSLSFMAQALGATPTPQSQTTSRQPGLFDYLTLGLSAM